MNLPAQGIPDYSGTLIRIRILIAKIQERFLSKLNASELISELQHQVALVDAWNTYSPELRRNDSGSTY
jgi:hypothetical protein